MNNIAAYAISTGAGARFCTYTLAAAVLTACGSMPPPAKVDFAEPRIQPATTSTSAARTNAGSLFQSGSYRPAFEDRRARLVGDTVTVQIVESLSASQVTKSTVNRNTSASNSITPPLPGILGPDLTNLNMAVKTDNDFLRQGWHRSGQYVHRFDHRHGGRSAAQWTPGDCR